MKHKLITAWLAAALALALPAAALAQTTTVTTIPKGGTGATTAGGARTNLGLAIGTNVQAYDADLAALAGLTSAADKCFYFTGAAAAATFDCPSWARTFLSAVNASGGRTALGVTIGTDVQAYDADLAALAGLTSAANKCFYFTGSATAATFDCLSWARSFISAADASAGRTALGVTIGTDVQAYDADLAALAGLTSAANKCFYFTGTATAATFDCLSWARSFISAADASAGRTALGVTIGTNVQAYDADLAALAGLTSAADKCFYFSGSATAATFDCLSWARSFISAANAGAGRTALGVAIGTDVQAYDADLAALAGLTSAANKCFYFTGTATAATFDCLSWARSFISAADASAGRTALGLGTVATQNTGTSGANIPFLNGNNTHSGTNAFSGAFDVQAALALTGDISPSQITSNTNNYAPTGHATATAFRLSTDASRNLTGLQGGSDGRIVTLHNIGGSNNLVLTNEDSNSTDINRFLLGGDLTLTPNASVSLRYDATTTRWRSISPAGGAGGGSGTVTSATIAAGEGTETSGTCTITTSGTCTVSMANASRRNILLNSATLAKLQVAALRLINTFADGYKASDGVNSGSSSNYTVDTTNGRVGPSIGSPNMISAGAGTVINLNMNGRGGAANAFDGTTSQALASSAGNGTNPGDSNASTSGYNNAVGKNYGSGQEKIIVGFRAYGPNNNNVITGTTTTTKLQVSTNGSAWTDLCTSSAWGGSSSAVLDVSSGSGGGCTVVNTTAYQYARLNNNGDGSNSTFFAEVQFFEPGTPNNMTLVTATQTADASASTARVLVEYDDACVGCNTATLNTDLTVEVTCNGGSNWATGTLASAGTAQSGRKVAEIASTACTAGTSIAARIKSLNNKLFYVYKTAVVWS